MLNQMPSYLERMYEFHDMEAMRDACPVIERIFFCCCTSHSYKQADSLCNINPGLKALLSIDVVRLLFNRYKSF